MIITQSQNKLYNCFINSMLSYSLINYRNIYQFNAYKLLCAVQYAETHIIFKVLTLPCHNLALKQVSIYRSSR